MKIQVRDWGCIGMIPARIDLPSLLQPPAHDFAPPVRIASEVFHPPRPVDRVLKPNPSPLV
jgi:hypothetical protein